MCGKEKRDTSRMSSKDAEDERVEIRRNHAHVHATLCWRTRCAAPVAHGCTLPNISVPRSVGSHLLTASDLHASARTGVHARAHAPKHQTGHAAILRRGADSGCPPAPPPAIPRRNALTRTSTRTPLLPLRQYVPFQWAAGSASHASRVSPAAPHTDCHVREVSHRPSSRARIASRRSGLSPSRR